MSVIPAHGNRVNTVALLPGGSLLASGSDDTTAKIWQVSDGGRTVNLHSTLQRHTSWVTSVALSPDGRWLASGGEDRAVHLWQVSDGVLVRTLSGHDFAVRSVAFSPDGQRVASGSDDKTARFWRVSDGTSVFMLDEHVDDVASIAIYPDDTRNNLGEQRWSHVRARPHDGTGGRSYQCTHQLGILRRVLVAPDEVLVPGQGYWIKPGTNVQLVIGGTPVASPVAIPLKVGGIAGYAWGWDTSQQT